MRYESGLAFTRHDHTREGSCSAIALACGIHSTCCCPGICCCRGESGVISWVKCEGGLERSHFAPGTRVETKLDAATLEEEAEQEEESEERQHYHTHHGRDEVEYRHLASLGTHGVIG